MIAHVRSVVKALVTATLVLTLVACGGGSDSSPDTGLDEDIADRDDSDSMPDDGPGEDTTDDESGDDLNPEDSAGDDTTDEDVDEEGDSVEDEQDTESPVSFVGPRIELQGTINHFTDSRGRAHLFGTVKNTGTSSALFVQANCDFYGADSSLVKEDSTYIIGTNLTFTRDDYTTNTALKPGEHGVFGVSPSMESTAFSTYACRYSFDDTGGTKDPDAKLELTGAVTVQEYLSYLEYPGQVENTGNKGLVFGQVYFVTRDTTDSIIDISWDYIEGETVVLESVDGTVGSALNAGSTGTFSAFTLVPFSDYGQHSIYLGWQDSDIVDGIASRSGKHVENSLPARSMEERNAQIGRLREQLFLF